MILQRRTQAGGLLVTAEQTNKQSPAKVSFLSFQVVNLLRQVESNQPAAARTWHLLQALRGEGGGFHLPSSPPTGQASDSLPPLTTPTAKPGTLDKFTQVRISYVPLRCSLEKHFAFDALSSPRFLLVLAYRLFSLLLLSPPPHSIFDQTKDFCFISHGALGGLT